MTTSKHNKTYHLKKYLFYYQTVELKRTKI